MKIFQIIIIFTGTNRLQNSTKKAFAQTVLENTNFEIKFIVNVYFTCSPDFRLPNFHSKR
jgi:hypothetical protein